MGAKGNRKGLKKSEKYQFFSVLQGLSVKKDLAEKNLYKVNFIIMFALTFIIRVAPNH